SDTLAIRRFHVLATHGQARAGSSVAELHRRLLIVVCLGDVDPFAWSMTKQGRHFLKLQIVDADFERGLATAGRVGAGVSQRGISQSEALIRLTGITAAHDFVGYCLAMSREGHIRVDSHRWSIEYVREFRG